MTSYVPVGDRYTSMRYRRTGRSGLLLPALSLGLWQNFGESRPLDTQRAILRRAFDLGITHFDLANNYGPPYGSAESNFGRILHSDFRPYRDELVVSTKAGWDMWPGPYGDLGSRKYLLASLDQSLQRLGLDYVDIYYHHHFDPDTPLEESLARCTPPCCRGRRSTSEFPPYSAERSAEAIAILRRLGTPLLIHQPSYSMLNRWIEEDLLELLGTEGVGCVGFTPLAQGLLTDKYLDGVPEGSRASRVGSLTSQMLSAENLDRIRALHTIAQRRGQQLAQMALAWALRDPRMTSLVIGASSVTQLEQNVAALDNLEFSPRSSQRLTSLPSKAALTCGGASPPAEPCAHEQFGGLERPENEIVFGERLGVAAKGCRAMTMPELPHMQGLPSYHDLDYWAPFFTAASEEQVVMCLHIGQGFSAINSPPDAPIDNLIILATQVSTLAAQDLLWGPAFQEFPDLKVAWSEAGIGWIPFYLNRCDRHYAEPDLARPRLRRQASERHLPGALLGLLRHRSGRAEDSR